MSQSDSNARTRILGRIRSALGAASEDGERRGAVESRLALHPAGLVPERARKQGDALGELFVEMLRGQEATVERVANAGDIPEAVARYLRDANLSARIRMGSDELLAVAPWEKTPALERLSGPANGDDLVSVSRAQTGAAETGTLFLTSGPENPTTLNFLPETHIAVIRADDLVGSYEEAWNRLRAKYGEGELPRTVNLISGPSRTADIEQTMVMGAHGPRRLHVIIVG
jgi:L-lactate dehydrogenase complex protein LldG